MSTRIVCPVLCLVFFVSNVGAMIPKDFEVKVGSVVAPLVDTGQPADAFYPSVGVLIVSGGHAAVYSFGRREIKAASLVEIGSVSKVFTSLLLAKLASKKIVDIDSDAEKFLGTSVKIPSFNGQKISLKHLSTHSSGLPRIPADLNLASEDQPYADYSAEMLLKFLSDYKLPRPPGSEYEYSNMGAALLGLALARAINVSFNDALVEEVLKPLDMSDTAINLSISQQLRLVQGYRWDGKDTPSWKWDVFAPTGGLKSTLTDMGKFILAQLNPPEGLTGAAVQLSQAVHFTSKPQKMGLAWHVIDLDEGETLLWHNGMTYGFSSNLVLAPASKMGVFVIANAMHLKSNGALDDRIDQLAFKIFGLLRKENKRVLTKASKSQIKQ